MQRKYVALLRAISNLPMLPFRAALEELAFADVVSYGMSGNLMFNATGIARATLEKKIARRLDLEVFVRTRADIARAVSSNPYAGERGAAVMFLDRAPAAARRSALAAMDVQGDPAVVRGRMVFFRYPLHLVGRRGNIDVEKVLAVRGTMRAESVVEGILARM